MTGSLGLFGADLKNRGHPTRLVEKATWYT